MAKHCFHECSSVLNSPSQFRCCFCGWERYALRADPKPEGHGPYLPPRYRNVDVINEECPKQ